MYKKLCIPVIPDAWEKFLESAELLKNVPTRTIMRITCMKGLNMDTPEKFSWLIEKMQPDVVECKAYAFMGYSMDRMEKSNTPNFDEINEMAEKLAKATGYRIALAKKGSDIVLLARTTPRIVQKKEYIYVGLEEEKKRQEEYNKEIALKL